MEKELPLKQIIDASLAKIGSVADVNTVIGEPIKLADGVTVIPFSKVSVGFASGGVDYDGKKSAPDANPHFAGGNGAGVSVTPLGFLIIENGNVRVLDLKNPATLNPPPQDPVNKALDAVNGVIDKSPEIISKVKEMFKKKDKPEEDAETVSEETK